MAERPGPARGANRPFDPRREPEGDEEPSQVNTDARPASREEIAGRKLARTLRSALTPSTTSGRPPTIIEEIAARRRTPPPDLEPRVDAPEPATPAAHTLPELEIAIAPGESDGATRIDGAAQASSAADDRFGLVGTLQAGTFRVQSVVAQGGFGVIYAAYHQGFDAKVALKCLKVPINLSVEQREAFLRKFEAEAQILFRLSSSIPEVVRPLHVGRLEADGNQVPFLALEWLEGDSLKTLIERRAANAEAAIPLPKVVELLTPIARALTRAHSFPTPEGPVCIVHCDIKPDNLFMVRTEEGDMFKVLDFGIAKMRDAATHTAGGMTGTDLRMFTPTYAAPEQWDPERFGQTGPWTDVHALALTLLEVAAQRPVYRGDPGEIIGQSTDPNKRPSPSGMGLPSHPKLDAVFAHALAVDPRDRTKTISEFWTALESALGRAASIAPLPEHEEPPASTAELAPEVRKKSFFNFKAIAQIEGVAQSSDFGIDVTVDSKPLTPKPVQGRELEPAADDDAPATEVAPAPPASEPPVATKPSAKEAPDAELAKARLRSVAIIAAASLVLTVIGVVASFAGVETYLQWVGAALLLVTVMLVALRF